MIMGFGTAVSLPGLTLAELKEVNWSGIENEAIESTHMASPNGWKEFDPSALTDPGELELTVNFDPDESPTFPSTKGAMSVTWPVPEGGTTGASWACDAMITGYEPGAPVDDKMSAKIKVKCSGEITFTPSA